MLSELRRIRTAAQNTVAWRSDAIGFFLERANQGPVVALPMALAREPVFIISGPDAIKQVLNQPNLYTKNTRGQKLLRVVLGVGLLTSQGSTWRHRRRIAQPAFRRPKLSLYASQMQDLTKEWVRGRSSSRVPFELHQQMMQLTLQIATVTLFGDQLEAATRVSDAMEQILSSYLGLLGNPLPHPERWPTRTARRYHQAIQTLNEVVDRLIHRRRNLGTEGDDLLHLWLHSDLDDEAVRDEVITMLLAAHETTANTLSFTLALLSRHPMVRRRLQLEVDGLATTSPTPAQAPWLEAVIQESLRLYPPVWITSRSPSEATTLEGVPLPRDALLVIPIQALHQDPNAWPNPTGFDPSRWAERAGGVWMPFGAGPRKCIGSHFAMLEARTVLTTIIRSLTLNLEPGVQLRLEPSITLRPADPLWIRATPRE